MWPRGGGGKGAKEQGGKAATLQGSKGAGFDRISRIYEFRKIDFSSLAKALDGMERAIERI